jgi:hypothetical protein
VKDACVNFLTHCYIDTEVEMKEIYTSHHMWKLFERSFLVTVLKKTFFFFVETRSDALRRVQARSDTSRLNTMIVCASIPRGVIN